MTGGTLVLAAPLAKGGEAVKAGPIGLGVILLLCIACYFLFKSMSKHMRNVRENFPAEGVAQGRANPPGRPTDEPPPATPDAGSPTDPPTTG